VTGASHPGLARHRGAPATVWGVTENPEDGMPQPPDEDPVGLVHAAAAEALGGGPLALSELARRLRSSGALALFDDDEDFDNDEDFDDDVALLDEILLETDALWVSEEGMVAVVAQMLDGAVFSRRLTERELAYGLLSAAPDLGAIDFDLHKGLALPDGSMLECCFPFDGEPGYEVNGSYVGVASWLEPLKVGDVVCLGRQGRNVAVEISPELGEGEPEQRALRAAFDARQVEGMGQEPDDLVLDALCTDPSLFRRPVLPVGELLERAGLEQRDGWFGLPGEDWEPLGVRMIQMLEAARQSVWGFDECCEASFQIVREAWGHRALGTPVSGGDDLRPVARALAHGAVAPAFCEYALSGSHGGSQTLASFASELSQLTGKLAAPGLFVRAVESEQAARVVDAESDLLAAVLADPDYGPALVDLAWYASDRGDAKRAVSLLRRAGVDDDHPELSDLLSRVNAGTVRAERNDPCPCGSGRKFKACCLNDPKVSLEERSGWLYRKIMKFTLRPVRRTLVTELLELADEAGNQEIEVDLTDMLADVAAFEGRAIEEFVEERGDLLPPDEHELARSWVDSRLALWEVVAVEPGTSLTARDTRTGDRLVVTERTASRILRPGGYLLARVVAVGSQHQIIGPPLVIELRQRESLLRLFDTDPEAEDFAWWLGAAFAPPRLTNREGEETVFCRAVLQPGASHWEKLAASLDDFYGKSDDGTWTDTTTVDDEVIVRGFVRGDGDTLVVEANSVERFDRMLHDLRDAVPGGFEILVEERLLPGEALARHRDENGDAGIPEPPDLPPEMARAVRDLMRQREDSWLDESIPALAGLTPREAADDPTRREDLLALLNEFDRVEVDQASGFMTFDVARLRQQLGLSAQT
jgi:hypothetical protein